MKIIECEQRSEAWFTERLGSIGGSSIDSVLAKGQGKMRKNLMYRLAGEILSGQSYEGYTNQHFERGIEEETEALNVYSAVTGYELRFVGLVKFSNHQHYSPDALIDPDGLAETKSAIPSVHIERIHTDTVELKYYRQIQYGLFVCDRKWGDFISYSPLVHTMPIWIKRFERDQKLIKEMAEDCSKFLMEMATIIRKIKEV